MASSNAHAILGCSDGIYINTLHLLVEEWLCNNLKDYSPPKDKWEIDMIRNINDSLNVTDASTSLRDKDVRNCLNQLVKLHVPAHLVNTTSHRAWLRFTFDILSSAGFDFAPDMIDRILEHDLSKYSHMEVLGYGIMFGEGALTFRQLADPTEKTEWDRSLKHHLSVNEHHPECFYPIQGDDTRDKSKSVMSLEPHVASAALTESVLDMLASRGERNLKHDEEFSVKQWFDIEEKYFFRYAEEDKLYVERLLKDFFKCLSENLQQQTSMKTPRGQVIVK